MSLQYSVHWPNEFLLAHLEQLLPNWSAPVKSVLVVLQKSKFALLNRTFDTENQKHCLREQFLGFSQVVVRKLVEMGYLTEVFDPQSGLPLFSAPGQLQLDDVAVVQACLGYPLTKRGGCSILQHPSWGSAVYPSILVSSAHPGILEPVVREIVASGNSHQTLGSLSS